MMLGFNPGRHEPCHYHLVLKYQDKKGFNDAHDIGITLDKNRKGSN